MPRRLVAVVALAALLPGCIAGLCTSDYSNSCSSTTPEVHHHYHEDDDDTGTVLVGAALGTAALAAILLLARSGNDDAAPKAAPAPVYIVRGEVPTDSDALRLERMFMQAHMSARAGRCEAARAITKHVLDTVPEHYDRYAADPAIARCL